MRNNLQHNPVTDTDKVISHYEERDGVPVKYVLTTGLSSHACTPYDVFYRDTPHPEFGNHYFGITVGEYGSMYICNADRVEGLNFTAIDTGDVLIYSRHRHDYVEHDGHFIDGGRAYVRSSIADSYNFGVKDGEIIYADND